MEKKQFRIDGQDVAVEMTAVPEECGVVIVTKYVEDGQQKEHREFVGRGIRSVRNARGETVVIVPTEDERAFHNARARARFDLLRESNARDHFYRARGFLRQAEAARAAVKGEK